ncbi:MAG: dephospho-CoA kinase [Bacteroidota bacterium]
MEQKPKLKIGVTGGIGSGKSLFCAYFAEKGYPVISADLEAKRVLENDPEVKRQIVSAFGKGAFRNDGSPDTAYIAGKVFASRENIELINSIIHPAVIRSIKKTMRELLKDNDVVFVEAALLYEARMKKMFNYVVLVTADEDIRVKRAAENLGVNEQAIRKRMTGQLPEDKKKDWADFTFVNNSTCDELKNKAEFFFNLLKKIGESN